MSLGFCKLTWSASLLCASHALSSETDEVVGLLLGHDVDGDDDGELGVEICYAMVLSRKCKLKDRVEVGHEHLSSGIRFAEALSEQVQCRIRVIGWYRSHPRITAVPGDMDVEAQLHFQSMDHKWVGLIFAVFPTENSDNRGNCQDTFGLSSYIDIMAFQSIISPGHPEKKNVQLTITPPTPGQGPASSLSDSLNMLVILIETMCNEEKQSYEKALRRFTVDYEPSVSNGEERDAVGLERAYCSAVYNKNLISIVADGVSPLFQVLVSHLRCMQQQKKTLKSEIDALKEAVGPDAIARAVKIAEKRLKRPLNYVCED